MASHREGVVIVLIVIWENTKFGFLETQAINYMVLVCEENRIVFRWRGLFTWAAWLSSGHSGVAGIVITVIAELTAMDIQIDGSAIGELAKIV